MYIPFARQSKDTQYNGERLVNWFLRPTQGAVSEAALMCRSGLVSVAEPGGIVREMTSMGGDLYAAANGQLHKYVPSTGGLTTVGTVADDAQTSMDANATQVAVVANDTYFVSNGTTVASYSTGAMTEPKGVAFIDGYFFLAGTVAGKRDGLTISSQDDGTTFDATQFAFAENSPDENRGLIVDHKRVYVFGAETVEVWWNTGSAGFPFAPSQSEVLEKGCLGGYTVAKADNAVYWIGQNKIVYRSFGGTPEVISSPEVKEQLDASTIERAHTFTDRGHEFYAIRRTSNSTLCFDMSTGLWAERATSTRNEPWITTCSTELNGVTYYGTSNGHICVGSSDTMTDVGAVLPREAVSMPVTQGGDDFSISRIELRAEISNSATVSDPQIMMQMSRNGKEWGVEKWRSLGGVGEYNKPIHWDGLGLFNRAQMRLRVTDPVRSDLYGIAYQ